MKRTDGVRMSYFSPPNLLELFRVTFSILSYTETLIWVFRRTNTVVNNNPCNTVVIALANLSSNHYHLSRWTVIKPQLVPCISMAQYCTVVFSAWKEASQGVMFLLGADQLADGPGCSQNDTWVVLITDLTLSVTSLRSGFCLNPWKKKSTNDQLVENDG